MMVPTDKDERISQKSRVTAFINTNDGLKVECWSIGDLLPDKQGNNMRMNLMSQSLKSVYAYSFAPGAVIFEAPKDTRGHRNSHDDPREMGNLVTVKEGVVLIDAYPESRRQNDDENRNMPHQFVFTGLNGDDWFYFEDETRHKHSGENCLKGEEDIIGRAFSGQDTTLLNFQYEKTPHHKVLHEGRCKFAGFQPSHGHQNPKDPDSGRFTVQNFDL